jgi:hypothetical protein
VIDKKNDVDYINSPKYSNSLSLFLKDNPNGVKDKVICRLLDINQDQLEDIFKSAMSKLRQKIVNTNK